MQPLSRHLTRTFFAGIVALLPIGGVVLGALWAERSIADSWLADQPFYFPGLGIVSVLAITYLVGLSITTLVGKLIWQFFDRLLDRLPALGMLYRTLKQILGYGEGADGLFERVVLIPSRDHEGVELGLVTRTLPAADGKEARVVVFVPAAPTPTTGRVVLLPEARTERVSMTVHEALRFLVAAGKLEEGEGARMGIA